MFAYWNKYSDLQQGLPTTDLSRVFVVITRLHKTNLLPLNSSAQLPFVEKKKIDVPVD